MCTCYLNFFIRSLRALQRFSMWYRVYTSLKHNSSLAHRQLNRSQSNLHIFFSQELKLYACYLIFLNTLISAVFPEQNRIFNVVQMRVHMYPVSAAIHYNQFLVYCEKISYFSSTKVQSNFFRYH